MVYQKNYAEALKAGLSGLDVQLLGFDPQPVSVRIARASNAQGENALGLNPDHGDRIWIENNFLWANRACDDTCPGYSKEVSDDIEATQRQMYDGIPPTNYKSGDVSVVR
jgi:hypothetical protein